MMVSLAKDVLARAGLEATDVDVLITTSTVFSPVPSLASMVVNALGMREDCQAYNLGGMGCRYEKEEKEKGERGQKVQVGAEATVTGEKI